MKGAEGLSHSEPQNVLLVHPLESSKQIDNIVKVDSGHIKQIMD